MVETTSKTRSADSLQNAFASRFGWKIASRPILVWATDAILIALVLVFPFLMGGREALGHRVLITLAMALGFVWCLHRARTGGRLVLLAVEPLIIAGLILVWVQTIPLSPESLNQLSSEYARLLPSWQETQRPNSAGTQVTGWSSASFYPAETQHAFLMLIAYGMIAFVAAQRLKSEADCHNLLKLLGISGIVMAAFAVVQLVTSNDRFFWFYRHPHTGTREVLKGAFTNRNHFAQFLSLSIGPLLWWMLSDVSASQTSERQRSNTRQSGRQPQSDPGRFLPRMLLLICATGGVLLAILLSLSRGGMISASLACVVCLAGLWKSGRVRTSLAWTMLALGVISIGGLIVFGQDGVEDRVSQLASGDADQIDRLNARRAIWKADIAAMKAFPVIGTGVGSHRFVYPLYMEDLANFVNVTFSHAESTYIHLALETGLIGVSLLALGIVYLLGRLTWNLVRKHDPRRVAALAAILASLVGGVFHAVVDFIWYAPAIVVSTILLGVAGLRLCSGFNNDRGLFVPRAVWLIAGVFCLLILCRSQPDLARRVAGERLWFQYLIAEQDSASQFHEENDRVREADDLDQVFSLTESEPADVEEASGALRSTDDPEDGSEADRRQTIAQATALRDQIHLLMASLQACPEHAEAHQHLALKCLRLFELLQTQNDNRLSLQQIRDVVISSQFQSTKDMYSFLKRAFGQNMRLVLLSDHHSRKSLALCPLIVRPYESLVATGFITDPSDVAHNRIMEQTLLLGGHSPKTRHAIGMTLLLEGRQAEAMEQWAKVFHSSRDLRLAICRTLAARNSVDVLLRQFDPSIEEMPEVLQAFREVHRRSDLETLAFVIAEKVRQHDGSETAETTDSGIGREDYLTLLMDTYRSAYEIKSTDACASLLRLAIECDPSAEPPRRALGLLMLEQKNYDEADAHFAWCSEQFPGDSKLDDLRRECRRLATNQSRRVMPASYQVP